MMKYFFILMMAVMFHSCGKANKEITVETIAGTYTVVKLNDMTSFPETPTFEINAQEFKVSGFSGCNRFFGSFTFSEQRIKFGKLGSTQMMCPEAQNKTEQQLLQTLEQVTIFNFENNTLRLLHGETILVEAKREIQ